MDALLAETLTQDVTMATSAMDIELPDRDSNPSYGNDLLFPLNHEMFEQFDNNHCEELVFENPTVFSRLIGWILNKTR